MAEHVNETIATLERICQLMKRLSALAKDAFEAGMEALYLQYLAIIDDLAICKARLLSTLENNGNG